MTQSDDSIRVLLAEDERMLAEILADTLGDRGFDVTVAYDGREALAALQRERYDVLVTDIMMPQMDGYTLVGRLRAEGYDLPVLFLTARSATEDVVRGFETGGNDFLRKPFAIEELIVRVKALAGRRREQHAVETLFALGRYEFDAERRTLRLDGREIVLSGREAEVLAYLCRRRGETVAAQALLREVWGDDSFFNLRSLNVFVSRLRRRLQEDPSVEIVSLRGVGYKLRC
ncbi:MAG: response regulator transcription factor [Alistipes sp.]|nr:response regulator transcription factor [Alistipes sp.]